MPTKEDLLLYADKIEVAAKEYKVSTRTIRRWLGKEGIYKPKTGYGPGKLDAATASEIRRLYQTDEFTQSELAIKFNVTQAMICRIVNNKAYHIDLIIGGKADINQSFCCESSVSSSDEER